MNNEIDNELEHFIDQELKRSPNLKAPDSLVAQVMQNIQKREVSWWQKSWIRWPFPVKVVTAVIFASLAAAWVSGLAEMNFAAQAQGWQILVANVSSAMENVGAVLHALALLAHPLKSHLLMWGLLLWTLVAFWLLSSLAISAWGAVAFSARQRH